MKKNLIRGFEGILHGGDYNPDQWLSRPQILDDDFKFMKIAGCNAFSVGIFSWANYEPREGVFDFSWLDSIMDRMAEAGNNVMLATPSAAKPAWMSKKYPEIRRVNRQGIRDFHHTRMNHCWTSPIYREKVGQINTMLAQRYAGHPALKAWHVSNEYHGECYCELCVKSWWKWLEEKYGTIERLNDAWWTGFWSHRYDSWDEIEPGDWVDGMRLDWRRFNSWQMREFMLFESLPLKEIAPDIPITTNMMGFYETVDYWRIAEICDFISDDSYPDWLGGEDQIIQAARIGMIHDMHRSMKKGSPFLLMESTPGSTNWKKYFRQKRPGVHNLEMMQAIAHGADGVCYFQWRKGLGGGEKFHGAVVDHSNRTDTLEFTAVKELGETLPKIAGISGSSSSSPAALIYDWEIRWAIDCSHGPGSADFKKYVDTCVSHYRQFWRNSIPCDVIESLSPFDSYRIISAPMLFMLKPAVAERLVEFVRNGGILVSSYLSGIVDEFNRCIPDGWPGMGLRQLFGVREETVDGLGPNDKQSVRFSSPIGEMKGDYPASEYCAIVHPEGAEILAKYTDDFYAGSPAVTVNRFGKGYAYYIGARLSDEFHKGLYSHILSRHFGPEMKFFDFPEGVSARVRGEAGREHLFIMNFNDREVSVNPPAGFAEALLGPPLSNPMKIPAHGVSVLIK